MESVVFMDCDGVINNREVLQQWKMLHGEGEKSQREFMERYYLHEGYEGYVVPELLERLKWLCDETGCKIVWSSSWREQFWRKDAMTGEFGYDWHGIARLWKAKGFPLDRLIGCTPCENLSRFSYVPRGVEIQKWIEENWKRCHIGRVAILDDDPDAAIGVEYPEARFFQTAFFHGLTQDIADEVVGWLCQE